MAGECEGWYRSREKNEDSGAIHSCDAAMQVVRLLQSNIPKTSDVKYHSSRLCFALTGLPLNFNRKWTAVKATLRRSDLAALLGLISLIAVTSGCLRASSLLHACYDVERDEFAVLAIYGHIQGDAAQSHDKYDLAADFKRLQALWHNRDHLFLGADILPGFPFTLKATAPLRIDGQTYALADLGFATLGEPKRTLLKLQDIRIMPGTLFLESSDNLCYYHQLVVPGESVDKIIAQLASDPENTKFVISALDKEIDRRKAGGTKGAWMEETQHALERLGTPRNDMPKDERPLPDLLRPLESDSLLSLRGELAKGSILVERRGPNLFLRLPMTPSDAEAGRAYLDAILAALVKRVEAEIRDLVHSGKVTESDGTTLLGLIQPARDTISVESHDKQRFELSVDVIRLFDLFWQAHHAMPDVFKTEGDSRTEEMATMAVDRLPVDANLRVQGVVDDFKAGRLRSHPSRKPIVPGTLLTN